MLSNNVQLIKLLRHGGMAVIPTDTIYGLSALALEPKSVEKIYRLKRRNPAKPLIILISKIDDLKLFDVFLDTYTNEFLKKIWPGKVTVVLPCISPKFKYLHRGTNSLAFRLPKRNDLQNLIHKTGPLISTSANPEGSPQVYTIPEIKKYFGDEIGVYIDEGKLESLPSTLISISDGKVKVLRQGGVGLSDLKIGKTF